MAHKLDFSKGKAAFVAHQEAAWHGLGTVFNEPVTLEQALQDGGLDFQVSKHPNIHRLPDGNEIISPDSFFTMREDVNKVLGSKLGTDYTVYQNAQALAVVDEMIATGKCHIEIAGAINDGARVFICLKMQEPLMIGGSDEISQYVLLANSHDGTLAITAMPTNVRVVCNNTLSAALGGAKGAHKIRHTANAHDRVKEAFTIMGILENNSRASAISYSAMKAAKLSQQEFFDYIGNIFMTQDEIKGLQGGERDVLSTRKKNILASVLEFHEAGVGQREALIGGQTMWSAYNAVTGYLTGKRYSSADDRFNSLLLGDSATKIKAAGELAIQRQRIQPIKQLGSFSVALN